MRPVPGLRLDQIDPGWGANVPAHWCTRLHGQRGPYMEKALGGSPLLQQGELDFSPAEKQSILKWALALGFSLPALKRVIKADLFRSAEALLPPHKCGGSHREGHSRIYLMPSGYGLGVEVPAPVLSLDLASDAGEGDRK